MQFLPEDLEDNSASRESGSTSIESVHDRPPSSASSTSGINPSGVAIRKRKQPAAKMATTQSTSKIEKTKAIELLEAVSAKFATPCLPVDEWKVFGDHVTAELRSLPYGQAKLLSRKMSHCMLDFIDENCP